MHQQDRSKSEELAHEREVLEELVRSEGWGIFVARVLNEWRGDGYFARMNTALKDSDPLKPKVVHATSAEVTGMLDWPKNRIKYLGGKTE